MSFPRYPAYKPSGVEWLGKVPEHWDVTALKHGYVVTLGKMLQPEAASERDMLLPYLRAANIRWSGVDDSDVKTMWFSPRDREHLLLQAGDLLVSEGGDVGRSALWEGEIGECYFQNSVNRVRPSNGNLTSFLRYWMSTMKDKGFIDVLCNKSTIAHFTAEKVGAVPVPLPPLVEQLSIATFLDHETAKIDALIAEQQRLSELLQEKRQAVISHAVTKGLNPVAPMKDSGVEWLGEVPEHWDIAAVGHRYSVQLGKMLDANQQTGNHSKPYLRVADVQWGEINTEDLPEMDFPPEAEARYRLKAGDLLVNEGGSYVGRSAIWSAPLGECYYQKALHRLRAYDATKDSPHFMYFLMEHATRLGVFIAGGNQTTIDHLTAEQLRRYRFAFPPMQEQKHIASYLRLKTDSLQQLTTQAESMVGVLIERRSALVSAAVTGQIDVRGLAPEASEQ